MLKIEQNPDNKNEYSIINSRESYYTTNLEELADYNNGDERGLVTYCENLGINIEYYSHIQNKYCTKEEYLKHFENYDSDKEFITPFVILTQDQATQLYNKLHVYNKLHN